MDKEPTTTKKGKQLESMGGKAEPMSKRKRSMSIVAKALTVLVPKSPSIPTLAQLAAAKPAEEGDYPRELFQAGLDHPNDGVWLCCNGRCRSENYVKHYQGTFPFKYLTCNRCDHILCSECPSSEILTPIRLVHMEAFEDRLYAPAPQVRYCRLCRACGLTYRGTFKHGRLEFPSCPCRKVRVEVDEYLFFFIGSNEAYRCNPQDVIVGVSLDRRLAALRRVTEERRSNSGEVAPAVSAQSPAN